ncbi:MAG: hypothetical protein HYW48_06230 [Deltaproteobacteria bacterium]|nr:hypothetical protein [Deltaproteobacteria bacterium]
MRKPLGARRWFGGNCAAGASKKNHGGATVPSPPQTPLSLFGPSGLRITLHE